MATKRIVEIADAGPLLDSLVAEVEAGHEVVLSRSGTPIARLVSLATRRHGIRLGLLKGKIPDEVIDELARPWADAEMRSMFGR